MGGGKVAARVLKIHESDNVAVALAPVAKGEPVSADGAVLVAQDRIPRGHKVAIRDLAEGDSVIKYGHVIGRTTQGVAAGSWVHSHNLRTCLDETVSYTYSPFSAPPESPRGEIPTFPGYKRRSGRVATRNEIWIINTVGCVNASAEKIASLCRETFRHPNVDGIFSFPHPYGCSELGDDLVKTRKILAGLMKHPNAGGVVLLGLGCERNRVSGLIEAAAGVDEKTLRVIDSQSAADEVQEGVNAVGELFDIIKNDRREECPISELVLGVKCGGSDGLSGITANPLVGRITDFITACGGRVLLSEVPEMFGAEHLLMNRARDETVYRQIVRMIGDFKEYFRRHNQPIYENPSPGNKEGGLTTLEEKSLGAIQKGGTAAITQALDYGEQGTERGLVLLKAPGNDAVSGTALVASGATLLLFATGLGTPLGFPAPTVKISSNTELFKKKPNWIDFDAGAIADSSAIIDSLTEDLLETIIQVASGHRKAKNETYPSREIAIWKDGVTV